MTKWRKFVAAGWILGAVLALMAALWLQVGPQPQSGMPLWLGEHIALIDGRYIHAAAVRVPRGVALIDAGQDPAGADIDRLLGLLGASRHDVHDIFLTSGRADHLAAVPLFAGARVWAGASDVALAASRGRPEGWLTSLRHMVAPAPAVAVTHALTADEEVDLGGARLRAIPVPGSSPGAYAYLVGDVLFVGDAARVVDGRLTVPPAAAQADAATGLASLRALATALGRVPVARICASHGGCTAPHAGSAALLALLKEAA